MQRPGSGYIRSKALGFTLVELLIAVVVAVFTVSSIMACYLAIRKGVIANSRRADMVLIGSVTAKRLESVFEDIYAVESSWVSDTEIRYISESSDTLKMTLRDSGIYKNSIEMVVGLRSVEWQIGSDFVDKRSILFWEAVTNKGLWVAGAVPVKLIGERE